MAANSLTTTTSSGEQTTTQSPQMAGQPAAAGTQSGSVQPGTAAALLNNQGGILLQDKVLPSVNLTATTSSVAARVQPKPAAEHNVSFVYFVLPALLLLVAVVFVLDCPPLGNQLYMILREWLT